ncbi:hypothetical protein I3760_01G190600 [Carya illinoinensis]|nr:hypothetical protein I3760_01G190600 [Carya illinoinensis]
MERNGPCFKDQVLLIGYANGFECVITKYCCNYDEEENNMDWHCMFNINGYNVDHLLLQSLLALELWTLILYLAGLCLNKCLLVFIFGWLMPN